MEVYLKTICVIGSINMDLFTMINKMPKMGETIFGESYFLSPGGKGANQAVATARLEILTRLIGKVGADFYGSQLVKALNENGVDTTYVKAVEGISTGFANIYVDKDGNNQITVIPGANSELKPKDIDEAKEAIQSAKAVVCQLEIPLETAKYALMMAKKAGVMTLLNPTPTIAFEDEILDYTDILIPNEIELKQIMKLKQSPDDHEVQAFMKKHRLMLLITTLGEKGCCVYTQTSVVHYPAKKVKVVNTTAAGDAFIGGFVTAYSLDKNIELAINMAQEVAALTVTKNGSITSLPYLNDLKILANNLGKEG